MADSNGHADHTASGRLSPALSLNRQADQRSEQSNPKEQEARKEAHQETAGVAVPSEWARVSQLAMKQLNRCMSLEPKVLRGDDPKAIHDLRVATRRLQQVLDLLYPKPHSGEIRKLYRGLKRCRRSLSEIRNYDVLLERVDGALARKRTSRREAWEVIRHYLKELRSVRLEKALRKLAQANLSGIYVRLKECLPGAGNSIPAVEISRHSGARQDLTAEEFYVRIAETLKSVWTGLEQEIAQSRHEPEPTTLHRTRIAAKHVRYLIEVINNFNVPGSKEVLVWLRSLQTQLGEWHDLVVFEEAVIGMIASPAFLRDHLEIAFQIERLIMRNRALKAKLEKKYFEMTQDKADFFKTREWMRRMVESPAAQFAAWA